MSRDILLPYRWPAAAALALLAIGPLVDLVPRFFLGDSRVYLSTSLHGYLPVDRSWLYGVVASSITAHSHSLIAVPLLQILLAWAAAVALGAAMARYFRCGPWFAVSVVAVVVWNPLNFYWARGFMTDTSAAALFAGLVAVVFAAQRITVAAAGVFVLAFGLEAVRPVYVPPLLVAFAATAALRAAMLARSVRRRDGMHATHRLAAARFAVLAGALVLAGLGDGLVNRHVLRQQRIATNYATAQFLVSAWSPLIAPGLAKLNLPPRVTQNMEPLTYERRLANDFASDGVVKRLLDYYGGNLDAARPAYSVLLRQAVLGDPVGFVALIGRSWWDYLDPANVLAYHRERRLSGSTRWKAPDTLPDDMITKFHDWGVVGATADMPQAPSFGLAYWAILGGWWSLLMAWHATLAPALYGATRPRRLDDNVLCLQFFAFAYMAMLAFTTNEMVTRYLIPLDIPLLSLLGACLARPARVYAGTVAAGA